MKKHNIPIIALKSPKGYKCLICFTEDVKAYCFFATSTFPKHLKQKHGLKLSKLKDAIKEDSSTTSSSGYVCPKCDYFTIHKGNYRRPCNHSRCQCNPDFVVRFVEVYCTGHLHRVIDNPIKQQSSSINTSGHQALSESDGSNGDASVGDFDDNDVEYESNSGGTASIPDLEPEGNWTISMIRQAWYPKLRKFIFIVCFIFSLWYAQGDGTNQNRLIFCLLVLGILSIS